MISPAWRPKWSPLGSLLLMAPLCIGLVEAAGPIAVTTFHSVGLYSRPKLEFGVNAYRGSNLNPPPATPSNTRRVDVR